MIGDVGDATRVANAPQGVGIEEAARAFEALFIEKFLEFGNRPLAGREPPIGGGSAERNYRQLFLREMATRVVERSLSQAPPEGSAVAPRIVSPFGLAAQIVRAAEREHAVREENR